MENREEVMQRLQDIVDISADSLALQSMIYAVMAALNCGEEIRMCQLMRPVSEKMLEYIKELQQLQTIQQN
jgi:hypothetical protein